MAPRPARPVPTGSALDRRLASLEKAAAYTDTSPFTIRRMIARGEIQGFRVGKRLLRVDLNEIDAGVPADPDRRWWGVMGPPGNDDGAPHHKGPAESSVATDNSTVPTRTDETVPATPFRYLWREPRAREDELFDACMQQVLADTKGRRRSCRHLRRWYCTSCVIENRRDAAERDQLDGRGRQRYNLDRFDVAQTLRYGMSPQQAEHERDRLIGHGWSPSESAVVCGPRRKAT